MPGLVVLCPFAQVPSPVSTLKQQAKMISISTLRAAGLTDEQIDVVQKAVESEKARWKADFENREKLAAKRERNRINQRNYRERKRVSSGVSNGAKIPKQNQRSRERLSSPVSDCHQQVFDEFWKAYPKRGSASNPKKPARDKFERAIKAGADPQVIIAAARRFCEVERQNGSEGTKFIPQASRWLNEQRWNDYPAPASELVHGVHVKADTPEWNAWCGFLRQQNKKTPPTDKAGGWWFETLWPPVMAPQGTH